MELEREKKDATGIDIWRRRITVLCDDNKGGVQHSSRRVGSSIGADRGDLMASSSSSGSNTGLNRFFFFLFVSIKQV